MKRMQSDPRRRKLPGAAFDCRGFSMKPVLLLLSAWLTMVAFGALAQDQGDACHNGYGSCVERCASRPKSLQEACGQTCEATTNQCYQGLFSRAPESGPMSASDQASAPEPEARGARDEARPDQKPKRR
jgi:hypothetical protein